MTAYALYGLAEARRAGYQVEEYRMTNGARALAGMYADYPRAEPDLEGVYRVCPAARPARGKRFSINASSATSDRRRGPVSSRRRLNELWDARARMSAYGRALLLLSLDDAKDGRGNELAQALLAKRTTKGELTWWATDHDPLLFDFVDTSVEATATALHALSRRDPQRMPRSIAACAG